MALTCTECMFTQRHPHAGSQSHICDIQITDNVSHFYTTKRVGGGLLNPEMLRVLRMAAA